MQMFFAVEETVGESPLAQLGVSLKDFLFQLITFVLVFLILKKFAFNPITKMLAKRRQVIDDGVRMGLRMEQEKAALDDKVNQVMREARHEADGIIATAHKEAREIAREAEKTGQRKIDMMLADAKTRITEESEQAKRHLEKEIVSMVADATEAIVEEKIDVAKDSKLIDKALKGRK